MMNNYFHTWTDQEDLLLTTAIGAVYQELGRPERIKSDTRFWGAVYEKMKAADPSFRRTQSGARNRWDHIAEYHPALAKVISFRYQRKVKVEQLSLSEKFNRAAAMTTPKDVPVIQIATPARAATPKAPEIDAICKGINRVADYLGVTTDDVIETIIDRIGGAK